ncbi:MAG: hypothetical protein KKE16_06040 [Firmicutes bacterium]|nr:hypothetical protein [Bacillota bacterium]
MNKKQYLASLIILGVVSIGLIVTNAIWDYMNWVLIIALFFIIYMFIKYRIDGSVQYFSTRFNMLLDYDLDMEGALKMAEEALKKAPTEAIKSMYRMYLGMAQYYSGYYDDAVKSFNQVELNRLNNVFHALVFAFTAYASFELHDQETFDQSLERIRQLKSRVPLKYQNFVGGYEEILDAIKNMDVSIDHYKEMVEKHFGNDDGFIARKINYNYRLSYYYKAIGDTVEMDKCLAFVIANGKNQHAALRAKEMFKGSVNIEDFVYDPTKKPEVVETVEPTYIETAEIIDESPLDEVDEVEELDEPEDQDEK